MKDRGEPVLKELRNKEIVRLIDEQKVTKTAIAKWFGITKMTIINSINDEMLHYRHVSVCS